MTEHVCGKCIGDVELERWIAAHATGRSCGFCGRSFRRPSTAPLDTLADHMGACIGKFYEDPAECLPYDSAEGGYQGSVIDSTFALLYDLLPQDVDAVLIEAISAAIGEQAWCENPFDFSLGDELGSSWRQFKERIMFQDRFFLGDEDRGPETEEDPTERTLGTLELLRTIEAYAVKYGLFRAVPRGTILWRSRETPKEEVIDSPLQMGPPPRHLARQANRMTPPGHVAFYLAESAELAIRETFARSKDATLASFELLDDIWILDLSGIRAGPGIFSGKSRREVEQARFLYALGRELSRPIERSDRIHIDYIPTQVFTEYFRRFSTASGQRVRGIGYPSSKDRRAVSYCFFYGQRVVELDATTRERLAAKGEWLMFWPPPLFRMVELSSVPKANVRTILRRFRK